MTKNGENLICLIISKLRFQALFFGSQKIQPNVVFEFKIQLIKLKINVLQQKGKNNFFSAAALFVEVLLRLLYCIDCKLLITFLV